MKDTQQFQSDFARKMEKIFKKYESQFNEDHLVVIDLFILVFNIEVKIPLHHEQLEYMQILKKCANSFGLHYSYP